MAFRFQNLTSHSEKNIGNEVSGTVAFAGSITGVVRVVITKQDIIDFKQGEILVTTMTTPSLMLAVEKAGAIVTDEGGMLCHAAIVSREFDIPCVIGTENATKMLKDGDLVEVDATNGKVSKL